MRRLTRVPETPAIDLGHVSERESPSAYCEVINRVLQSRLRGSRFVVYPRSAPRLERVPPGCFTLEIQLPRRDGESVERFSIRVSRLKNLLLHFDLEETQPTTGGVYLYDGSDDQPLREVEDSTRPENDRLVAVVFLAYANPTLIGAEEIERQAARQERSDRMN